jgi:hypothetical protein
MKFRRHIAIATFLGISVSCSPNSSFDSDSEKQPQQQAEAEGKSNAPEEPVIDVQIDDRTIEEVLCQEGPKIIGAAKEVDFSQQFQLVCEQGTTNAFFKEVIQSAYQGEGEPKLFIPNLATNEQYVTNLTLAYALKVPLENPSMFADLRAHDIFAEGIDQDSSNLVINVESRKPFPGKRSIETVTLNYDLTSANGAGIYDKRTTEFDTYILIEDNQDITVSTEHLINAEQNEHYHLANGLTIGIKDGQGQSYLMFITDLVIKNRIDPMRMEVTMQALNLKVAKMLHEFITQETSGN